MLARTPSIDAIAVTDGSGLPHHRHGSPHRYHRAKPFLGYTVNFQCGNHCGIPNRENLFNLHSGFVSQQHADDTVFCLLRERVGTGSCQQTSIFVIPACVGHVVPIGIICTERHFPPCHGTEFRCVCHAHPFVFHPRGQCSSYAFPAHGNAEHLCASHAMCVRVMKTVQP